jgi:hypothetical protein
LEVEKAHSTIFLAYDMKERRISSLQAYLAGTIGEGETRQQ